MKYLWVASVLVGSAGAFAQPTTPSERAELPASLPADAPDPRLADYAEAVGLTLFWENDGALTNPGNTDDRWYTAGSGAAIQWQGPATTDMLSTVPSIGGEYDAGRPGVTYAGGVLFSLNIYTPENITDPNIRPDDRPYAGWTYLGFITQRADRAAKVPTYEHLEFDVGAMGPMSRAEDAQKWVHRNLSGDEPRGWEYQVRDEVGIDFKYQRRWRMDVIRPSRPTGPAMQLIPDAGLTLGTIHMNASAGSTLRFGWNLPDDFGPGNMRYAEDFTRPLGPNSGLDRGISGYLFVRPGVRAIAHDATFGESFFRQGNPVEVDTKPFVGEFTAGVVVTFFRHWRVTYSHSVVSMEFDGQGEWASFGSLNLAMVQAW